MRKALFALLTLAMVGAFAAPAFAQSAPTCFGPNNRVCIGEGQDGNGFIKILNKNDFGVYQWVNSDITAMENWEESQTARKQNIHNVQMLLISHTHAVDYGSPYPYVNYGIPKLTRSHGILMSITHECGFAGNACN